jgi:hypothetical protein
MADIKDRMLERLKRLQKFSTNSEKETLIQNMIENLDRSDHAGKLSAVKDIIGMRDTRFIPPLIRALKTTHFQMKDYIFQALKIIGFPAVPTLIETLNEKSSELRKNSAQILVAILTQCKSSGEVCEFETQFQEGYERLVGKHRDTRKLALGKIEICKIKIAIAIRKNKLSKGQGVLLEDKPKLPKRGIYQQARRIKNG